MLKVENVIVNYHEQETIGPFNLEVDTNQIISIIGSSGAGKSTLIKVIANVIKPTQGKISLNQKEILKTDYTYITQNGTLFNHLTIRDNLTLTCDISNYQEVFEQLKLPIEYIDQYPFQLSGGERQRIDLARAILTKSKLIILDEAFNSLDSRTKDDIYEVIQDMQKKYKILILFVTHDLQEALLLADKVILISDGQVKYNDSPKQLLNEQDSEINQLITKDKMKMLRSFYDTL